MTMKILSDIKLHSVLLSTIGVFALSACVNEEYDFSKEIDTDMTILKNVSIPLGSIEKITVAKLLTLNDNESLIRTDAQGNFVFSFSGSDITTKVDVPSFEIASEDGIHTEPVIVPFTTGSAAGKDPSQVKDNILYSSRTGGILSTSMPITVDSELPERVVDVKSVGLDASCDLKFYANGGPVYLKQGFVIEFPSMLNLNPEANDEARFELIDNHKLRVKKDLKVSPSSPLIFALLLDNVDVPEGSVKNGHLVVEKDVILTGDFYISPSDYSVIPSKVTLQIQVDITDLEVLTSEVKLVVDEKVNGDMLEIRDMPDFLSGGNICLDIYNPTINVDVVNSTPVSFDVHAAVVASNDSKTISIALGEEPAINVAADSHSKYVISRRECSVTEGVANIVVPQVGELISMLPKTIAFNDINIHSATGEYVTVIPSESYSATISYNVYAPLAFDKDLSIEYSQDINGLGFSLGDVNAEKVNVSLSVISSIPLEFNIVAEALDPDGNVMKDVDLSLDNVIKAGTLDSPVQSDITLSMTSQRETIIFDGLRLGIKAVSPSEDMYGVSLNSNHSLEIKDIVLTCPEGVIVKM